MAKRIVAVHDVANPKSGNVMKRAGMTKEGVLRKAGKNNYHTRCDLAIYSILDEEISMN
ncbi:MAG: GNAT family N-acetyltransferase [Clostridia bacterium]|nr:GNAT family N-acetyltransferase [Clostridia bacterium]